MKKRGRSAPPLTLFLLSIQRNTTERTAKQMQNRPFGQEKPHFQQKKPPECTASAERRRAQEDFTRAAEAKERRTNPDKFSLFPFQTAPQGAKQPITKKRPGTLTAKGKNAKRASA